MAIDKVVLYQNTSVLHDEILSHRLGLLPILADPELFDFKEDNEAFNENNTLKFYINIKCTRKTEFTNSEDLSSGELPFDRYLDNHYVYASNLSWEPIGDQASKFKGKTIKILHDKILIAKLGENQEIEAEVYCTKNIGKVHTKWSPVSTAFYRLFPEVKILKPVTGEQAVEIKSLCPTGVFDIEDLKGSKGKRLTVANEMNCTTCRACINHETLGSNFELGKTQNRYHFTVESVGVLEPAQIFSKALEVLREKAVYYQNFLAKK
jgi:DNA-directed RNA polymerase I and III subunit RPAC1